MLLDSEPGLVATTLLMAPAFAAGLQSWSDVGDGMEDYLEEEDEPVHSLYAYAYVYIHMYVCIYVSGRKNLSSRRPLSAHSSPLVQTYLTSSTDSPYF